MASRELQGIEQTKSGFGQFRKAVLGQSFGRTIAWHVPCKGTEAGVREMVELMAKAGAVAADAVQKEDRRAGAFFQAGRDHRHAAPLYSAAWIICRLYGIFRMKLDSFAIREYILHDFACISQGVDHAMGSEQPTSRELRNALGRFTTGVTVVTGIFDDGSPAGLTCNSFNSVSLSPPIIVWSLIKSSYSAPAFVDGRHFAINVLRADQVDLSQRFATRGANKFDDVETYPGIAGVPLLKGAIAIFQCEKMECQNAGDHFLFLGSVLDFSSADGTPLLFHTGRYAVPSPHPQRPG